MAIAFLTEPPATLARGKLSEDDAVAIWMARFLRVRPKELVRRYQCDPRRLYEIWEEARFPGTRAKALALLNERYPGIEGRFDPGPHQRFSRAPDPRQMDLFAEATVPVASK
jgi:hypothetical protein